MLSLLQRLEYLKAECEKEKKALLPQLEEEGVDDFTRLKKNLALQMKRINFAPSSYFCFPSNPFFHLPLSVFEATDIRILIQERDNMEALAANSVQVVELSHQIFRSIREAEKDTKQLDTIQKEHVISRRIKQKRRKRSKLNSGTSTSSLGLFFVCFVCFVCCFKVFIHNL